MVRFKSHLHTYWKLFTSLSAALCLSPTIVKADPLQLTEARFGLAAVVVDSSIYIIGGSGPQGFLKSVETIDLKNSDRPITVSKPPIRARRFHTAQAYGRYIYIMGGVWDQDDIRGVQPVMELWDTRKNTVEKMAPLPLGLRLTNSTILGKKIYIAGGQAANGEHVAALSVYDIATDEWNDGAPMSEAKECAIAARKGNVYAVGGFDGAKSLRTFEAYDIATDKWRQLPSLPANTSANHIAIVGHELYSFGDYTQLDRVCAYNFVTKHWRLLKHTGYKASRHNAVVAVSDTIYVIGGNTDSTGAALGDIQVFSAKRLSSL